MDATGAVKAIIDLVASEMNATPEEIVGPGRTQDISAARHTALLLCAELISRPSEEIVRPFNRDRTLLSYSTGALSTKQRNGRPKIGKADLRVVERLRDRAREIVKRFECYTPRKPKLDDSSLLALLRDELDAIGLDNIHGLGRKLRTDPYRLERWFSGIGTPPLEMVERMAAMVGARVVLVFDRESDA